MIELITRQDWRKYKQQFKFIKMEKTVKFKIKADGERVLVTAGCCVYALTKKETENLMLRIRDLLNKMGSEIEEVYMSGKDADMLSKKQRDSIERCSQRLRYEDKDRIDYFAKLKETSIKSHKS